MSSSAPGPSRAPTVSQCTADSLEEAIQTERSISSRAATCSTFVRNTVGKCKDIEEISNGIYETISTVLSTVSSTRKQIEAFERLPLRTPVTPQEPTRLEQESEPKELVHVLDNAIGVITDEVLTLNAKIETDRKDAVAKKKQLDQLISDTIRQYESAQHDMRTDGIYVWRIDRFNDLFNQHKGLSGDINSNSIYSQRFQTPEGYQFRMRLFLNGAGKGKDKYVSVFIQMCKTEYDQVLVYPFQGLCSVTIYDQNTNPARLKKEHFTVKFKTNNSSCFQRPVDEYNPENGIAQFVSHETLLQHKSMAAWDETKPVYISQDVLFIGAEVKYNINKIDKLFSSAGVRNQSSRDQPGRGEPGNVPPEVEDFQETPMDT